MSERPSLLIAGPAEPSQHIPRFAIIGAAALMVGTIAISASARLSNLAAPAAALPPPIASVDVRFEDRPSGALAVINAATGADVIDVPPGTNGFIRGVLRGMFRSRKLESLHDNTPYRLARQADGHLTLDDPETSRHIDLDSFGPTNSEAFASILQAATGNTPEKHTR